MTSHNDLIASSSIAWILENKFVNELNQPIEFKDHRFLIEYMADQHPFKVTKKSSQVGLTVAETYDNFHLAHYAKMNVIHTLQTKDVIKGFVVPKVNPIINNNPAIKALVTVDNEGLKQVGDNFVFYRGANAESQAINISADVLKIDELDRSNAHVVDMYPSRLDASRYGWKRYFSNPSAIGFGVDGLYNQSDARHWFVKCKYCNHNWWMDWEKSDEQNHYVNIEKAIYACGKCDREITRTEIVNGYWVAKFPGRKMHGYWFSQLIAPWFTAQKIIDKYESTTIDNFNNFVLGKAYTPSDLIVNRQTILRACAPSTIQKLGVVIGVDQNANEQIWVAGTTQGVFAHGKTKSWEELEHLKLQWKARVVCDPNPYPTMPKLYAEKYTDWFLCYFKQQEALSFVTWKGKVVYADRTRLLDTVASEITDAKLLFREHAYALEDYIADWQNIYRTTVEQLDGRVKSTWLKKEGKNSDYSFATAYMRIGLAKEIGSYSSFNAATASEPKGLVTIAAGSDSLNDAVEQAMRS